MLSNFPVVITIFLCFQSLSIATSAKSNNFHTMSSGNPRARKPVLSARQRPSNDDFFLHKSKTTTDNKRPSVSFSASSDSSVSMPIIPPVNTGKPTKFKSTANIITDHNFDKFIVNTLNPSSTPNDHYVRTAYTVGNPSPFTEESLPGKDNTSKLAHLWEDKISGSDEKGVRKTNTVDIPDEIIIHGRSQEKTGPIHVNLGPVNFKSTGSTQSNQSGVTPAVSSVLKSPAVKPTSPSSMREKVEAFERLASSSTNKSDRAMSVVTSPTAATQLGVGLRPINSDVSRRPSESSAGPLNRRLSSLPDSVDNSVDEVHRKIERMQLRIAYLERQYAALEKKFDKRS